MRPVPKLQLAKPPQNGFPESTRGDTAPQKYQMIRAIGRGSFGEVHLVSCRDDPKLYVMKVVKPSSPDQITQEGALAPQEVAVLRSLTHPNIVTFKDAYPAMEDGCLPRICIVMEYCEGGDLAQQITAAANKGELFAQQLVLDWFVQLCLALRHLHGRRVLHRDIKPSNCMLTHGRRILKLGDFGVTTILESTGANALTMIGTPYYFSPELCQSEPYGTAADIWALGVVLYQLMTLQVPFKAKHLGELMKVILTTKPPSPDPARYSPTVISLSARMLRKSAARRPTAAQMLQEPALAEHVVDFTRRYAGLYMFKDSQRSPLGGPDGLGLSANGKLGRRATTEDSRPSRGDTTDDSEDADMAISQLITARSGAPDPDANGLSPTHSQRTPNERALKERHRAAREDELASTAAEIVLAAQQAVAGEHGSTDHRDGFQLDDSLHELLSVREPGRQQGGVGSPVRPVRRGEGRERSPPGSDDDQPLVSPGRLRARDRRGEARVRTNQESYSRPSLSSPPDSPPSTYGSPVRAAAANGGPGRPQRHTDAGQRVPNGNVGPRAPPSRRARFDSSAGLGGGGGERRGAGVIPKHVETDDLDNDSLGPAPQDQPKLGWSGAFSQCSSSPVDSRSRTVSSVSSRSQAERQRLSCLGASLLQRSLSQSCSGGAASSRSQSYSNGSGESRRIPPPAKAAPPPRPAHPAQAALPPLRLPPRRYPTLNTALPTGGRTPERSRERSFERPSDDPQSSGRRWVDSQAVPRNPPLQQRSTQGHSPLSSPRHSERRPHVVPRLGVERVGQAPPLQRGASYERRPLSAPRPANPYSARRRDSGTPSARPAEPYSSRQDSAMRSGQL